MKSDYQKIFSQPTFRFRFAESESLWMGTSHLLWANRSGYFISFQEEYRRIEYQAIQGITIHRQPTQRVFPILLLISSVFFILCGVASAWFEIIQNRWFSAGIASPGILLIIPALLQLTRGAPLHCTIHTAAQDRLLKPIDRESRLQKFLELVLPKIAATQPEKNMETLLREIHQHGLLEAQAKKTPPLPYLGQIHQIAFSLLIAEALTNGIPFLSTGTWTTAITTLFGGATFIFLIIAQSKERSQYHPQIITRTTLISILYFVGVKYIAGTIALGALISSSSTPDYENPLSYFSKLSPQKEEWYYWYLVFSAILSGILGSVGLVATRRWFSKLKK
jgi:hypothetical protein